MRESKRYLLGVLVIIILAKHAVAAPSATSEWGDLGYTKPTPEVETIPSSITDEPVTSIALNDSINKANTIGETEEKPKARVAPSGPSNVSTIENTFGVETEEKPPLQIYIGPFAGMSSSFGNTTVDLSPNYALGGSLGLLLMSNLSVEASFIHAEQGVSAVRSGSTSINVPIVSDVYLLKQNQLSLGVKLFFLGRESKFRPYFGGGFGYAKSTLNYQTAYAQSAANQGYTSNDFVTNQVSGFGQLGVEYAFTKMIVANAMVKVDGILSANSSFDKGNATQEDFNRTIAGNSLSHTASFTLGAGVGFYF